MKAYIVQLDHILSPHGFMQFVTTDINKLNGKQWWEIEITQEDYDKYEKVWKDFYDMHFELSKISESKFIDWMKKNKII